MYFLTYRVKHVLIFRMILVVNVIILESCVDEDLQAGIQCNLAKNILYALYNLCNTKKLIIEMSPEYK